MKRGIIYQEDFHPQFSGHETFPLRYGWLKKVFDAVYKLEMQDKKHQVKDLFLNDRAIAHFGVGKNMVASMRHWATSSNVIEECADKNIVTTDLAKLLLKDDGLDPWMENTSSIWTFHWHIASDTSKATYLWSFSHFNNNQFDRSQLTQNLMNLCEERGWKISIATVKRDVECLVRSYVNKPAKSDEFSEDQIESPLAELGIIQPINRNDTFQIKRTSQPSLGDGVFLYALIDFWKKHAKTARTLSLEAVTYEPYSPGRVLCLDEDSVADRLYSIEKNSDGILTWSETAGLRQIIASKPLEEIYALDFLRLDYQNKILRKAI